MISELVPHLADLADDLCFVHSMQGKTNTHGPGENYMSTGYTLDGFPEPGRLGDLRPGQRGSKSAGLRRDSRSARQTAKQREQLGAGISCRPAFQGTEFNATNPIRNLARPDSIPDAEDDATRDFLRRINEHHAERFPGDTELAARIASYQLAARMQLTIPEVADLSSEPRAHSQALWRG